MTGFSRRLWVTLSILAGALLSACSEPPRTDQAAHPERLAQGARLYRVSCASCHGDEARGDGPVSPHLTVRVPDLTRIAARRGGEFPELEIFRIIDGQANLAAHGPRHMPVWGYEFFGSDADDAAAHARATRKIELLLQYLRSIQRKDAGAGVHLGAEPTAAQVEAALGDPAAFEIPAWDWGRWQAPLRTLYAGRGHAPLWISRRELTPAAVMLLEQLRRAERRGLIAEDYEGARLAEMIADVRPDGARLARLDVMLSVAAARVISDLHRGRIDPASLGYELDVADEEFDVASAVNAVSAATDAGIALDSFEPRLTQYALLKSALGRYQDLARQEELTPLPTAAQSPVREGDEYEDAPALRRLLAALGDLPAGVEAGNTLDAALVEGLRSFQSRHGLEADGILGRDTLRALRTPLALRAQQIALSMERMRWLPPLDSPTVIVNVPQFRLFAFRSAGAPAGDILRMDVIVGEVFENRQTPIFAADMRTVVIHPFWDVPFSILRRELLPQIERDHGWISRNGYEIVAGPGDDARAVPVTDDNLRQLRTGKLRLRQKPGPANALGRVKFLFPNRHNVYLHDTPARELFNRSRRAFSHGCIRVAEPLALLAHVLRDEPGWDEARIAAALQSDETARIQLSSPIRVLILYGTALVTEAGTMKFFEDIYGHDAPLIALLDSRRGTT